MSTVTPSKLITDYFPKTPLSVESQNTDNNLNAPDKITIVLPPTPESSPFKDAARDNKSSEKTSHDTTQHINKDVPATKPKPPAAKSLALNNKTGNQAGSDAGSIAASEQNKKTGDGVQEVKKSRRRRKARNKKSALNQSSDQILTNEPLNAANHKKTPTPQNKLVTDYFPIRRSGRRCESKIKEDKEKLLRQCITNNCEHGLKVEQIENKGRGVLATKPFDAGDFVVEYAGELVQLSTAKQREDNYSKDEDVGCYMYYFENKGKRYCVDATAETGRLGRLVNHSKLKGNCQTRVVEMDGLPRLILVVMRRVSVGEELLYDYGDRSPASLEAHPWLRT